MGDVAYCKASRLVLFENDVQIQLVVAGDTAEMCVRADGSTRMCATDPPLSGEQVLFGNAQLNAQSSTILLWSPTGVALIDTAFLFRTNSWIAPPVASATSLLSKEDLAADDDVVVGAKWHSISDRHVCVLTRTRLLVFDTSDGTCTPCDDFILPPLDSAVPSCFDFGAARGWELLSVFITFTDGSVMTICPFFPRGGLLLSSDWSSLRRDAGHAVEQALPVAQSSEPTSRARLHAVQLHVEWLDACFIEAIPPSGPDHPGYVRYAPPDGHPLFGPNAPRMVAGLQGPVRVRPVMGVDTLRAPVVDLHVHSLGQSELPLMSLLHSDGCLTTLLCPGSVCPSWTQQGKQEQRGRNEVSAEVEKYTARQVVLSSVPWGQQLCNSAPPSMAASPVIRDPPHTGSWVLLPGHKLPVADMSTGQDGSALGTAAHYLRASRGTVPGASSTEGLAAHRRRGAPLDIVAAPYCKAAGPGSPLPGLLLVVSRSAVLAVVHPPSKLTPSLLAAAHALDARAPSIQEEIRTVERQLQGCRERLERRAQPALHKELRAQEEALCIRERSLRDELSVLQEAVADCVHMCSGAHACAQTQAHAMREEVLQKTNSGDVLHAVLSTAQSLLVLDLSGIILGEGMGLDDVCGVGLESGGVTAWCTRPGQGVHVAPLLKVSSSSAANPPSPTPSLGRMVRARVMDGMVLVPVGEGLKGGPAEAEVESGWREGVAQFQGLPSFSIDLHNLDRGASSALSEVRIAVTAALEERERKGQSGEGEDKAGAGVLKAVASVSERILQAIAAVDRLRAATAARRHVLSQVCASMLKQAQLSHLHGDIVALGGSMEDTIDCAQAARASLGSSLDRAERLHDRAARAAAAGAEVMDRPLVEGAARLAAVLRDLSIGCQSSVMGISESVERLGSRRGGTENSAGGRSMACALHAVHEYRQAVRGRVEGIREEQTSVALAIAALQDKLVAQPQAQSVGEGQIGLGRSPVHHSQAVPRAARVSRSGLPVSPTPR